MVLHCKSRAGSKDYVEAEVQTGSEGDNGEGAPRTLLGRGTALPSTSFPTTRCNKAKGKKKRKDERGYNEWDGDGDGDGGLS